MKGPHSATTAKVLKALSVFGSVQVITMACSVLRTKLAALWLGPVGVGILGVYTNTMELISQTSQLNISQSAVRDIAACRHDRAQAASLTTAVRRVAMVLSAVAMVLVLIFAPVLSKLTFGNGDHTVAYMLLSLWLPFAAMAATEMAVMRANEQLTRVARTTLFTALTAIVIAVPLFYFFRLKAIVPVLLTYYGLNCLFSFLFRDRTLPAVRMSLRAAWSKARGVLALGGYLTVSSFVTLLASTVFISSLNRYYGDAAAGIYQAGYTLLNTYVGMLFTAIAMEYYPRLSSVSAHPARMEVIVSHEIKIALWVLMPVAVIFVCCSHLIVDILYADTFVAAVPFVMYGAAGVFFRAVSWCMAFTILAKGDGRTYICTECASSALFLILYILLYEHYGFVGLGVGYVVWYAAYALICHAVYRRRYHLKLRRGIAALTGLAIAVSATALLLRSFAGPWLTLVIMLPPLLYFGIRNVMR